MRPSVVLKMPSSAFLIVHVPVIQSNLSDHFIAAVKYWTGANTSCSISSIFNIKNDTLFVGATPLRRSVTYHPYPLKAS